MKLALRLRLVFLYPRLYGNLNVVEYDTWWSCVCECLYSLCSCACICVVSYVCCYKIAVKVLYIHNLEWHLLTIFSFIEEACVLCVCVWVGGGGGRGGCVGAS